MSTVSFHNHVLYATLWTVALFVPLFYYLTVLTVQPAALQLLQKQGFAYAFRPFLQMLHLVETCETAFQEALSKPAQNITFRAHFRGLDNTSLSGDGAKEHWDSTGSFHSCYKWVRPAVDQKTIPVESFGFLMPAAAPTISHTWWLINPETPVQLNNFRYQPSMLPSKVAQFFHDVLSMLHPNVFLLTRARPRGAVAIVRGIGNDMIEVMFRLHAEFQLNSLPELPFWFTPGQFKGCIVIGNGGKTLKHFDMHVPAERRRNVDLEWLTGYNKNEEEIEVDIGFMPEMSVHLVGNEDLSEETWDQLLSTEDAQQLLDQAMYPFLELPYYNLSTAQQKASEAKKLLHVIVSWGSLDDQSC